MGTKPVLVATLSPEPGMESVNPSWMNIMQSWNGRNYRCARKIIFCEWSKIQKIPYWTTIPSRKLRTRHTETLCAWKVVKKREAFGICCAVHLKWVYFTARKYLCRAKSKRGVGSSDSSYHLWICHVRRAVPAPGGSPVRPRRSGQKDLSHGARRGALLPLLCLHFWAWWLVGTW